MARVNNSLPADVYRRARRASLNVSRLAQRAVGAGLDRFARIAALDAYLAELEAELGPVSEAERMEASSWADRVLGEDSQRHSA